MLTFNRTTFEGIENPIIGITKRKVLIVDDDEFCRGLLFEVLRDKHYCKVVSMAEQALKILENEHFDLVLTDIRMPRKNGLELLSDIRKIHPKMLVIIMTGYAGLDSTVEALRLHAFDFLSKPIDCDTLLDTVDRALLQVAINEENQKFEEDIREAMSTRSNQVRLLFESIYQNYHKLLMETAESLEVRGIRNPGHIQRTTSFALRLGVEAGLSDADLMILEQGLLRYEGNKIGAPDEVLRDEHIFDVEEWKEIFQKEPSRKKPEHDWKIFSLAQRVAQLIEKGQEAQSINIVTDGDDSKLNFLSRIANFAENLCLELENGWETAKDLDSNLSLQIMNSQAKVLSDPQVHKVFTKIFKLEWMYLYSNPEKYLNDFEARFRQVFYFSVLSK